MHLSSPAFRHGETMPKRFTCDGGDSSPPLLWDEVPAGTRSLALVVEDPDAPSPTAPTRHTYTHWVLYNLPPELHGLDEAVELSGGLPEGVRSGLNDGRRPMYGGPCPPRGRHRYIHRLYALDTALPDLGHPTRKALLDAIEGHVLATAELIGTFERH